jgi:hypothetical protein
MSEVASFRVVLRDPPPPSINHMYFNGSHGRVLTKEGRAFKDALKDAVVQAIAHKPWKEAVDEIYERGGYVVMTMQIYRGDMYNKSWRPGSKTPSGALRSPYQKLDATNYAKIIEDAVVLGTGIDDSAHLEVTVGKSHDPADPRIEVYYYVYPKPG